MTAAAKKRDIHLTSRSRPLKPDDFTNFDYIIGMDHENSKAIKQAAMHWQDDLKRSLPDNWQNKVNRMPFCPSHLLATRRLLVTHTSILSQVLLMKKAKLYCMTKLDLLLPTESANSCVHLYAMQVKLMYTYLTKDEYKQLQEVPDPYFGGAEGFEKVCHIWRLDMCNAHVQLAMTDQCIPVDTPRFCHCRFWTFWKMLVRGLCHILSPKSLLLSPDVSQLWSHLTFRKDLASNGNRHQAAVRLCGWAKDVNDLVCQPNVQPSATCAAIS